MGGQELLRILYSMEKPHLQTNAWPSLRIRVADLLVAATMALPQFSRSDVLDCLRTLRVEGQVMFLPDWERWGEEEDEEDGAVVDSKTQWEPDAEQPVWRRRRVFMPEDLDHWFVRSRVAETARLLFANRERFGLEASTSHLGYELQPRFRPNRDAFAMADAIREVQTLVDAGALSRAERPDMLTLAIEVAGQGLGYTSIAAFQVRAWQSVLRSLFGEPRQIDATMVTAGVSSGKTYSFLLPLLTLLIYRALCGEGGRNRALIIYPRTSLVEDQYHVLRRILASINAHLAQYGKRLTELPALDAGQMLSQSLEGGKVPLSESLELVGKLGVEVILTTPESLKNRMLNPRAVKTFLEHMEIIVFDEIHLMEGLAGCHGIYFVRRLRQLIRNLRQDRTFEPAWIGASATVAEPVAHAARVLSLDEKRVNHVAPKPEEMIRFGTFHHLFLHTRAGKPSISAVTNGVSCLVHTRNDGTAHAHYEDPSASTLKPKETEKIQKTIVFVDSLSTIGRLSFTTEDNERTYKAYEKASPYYSWFYRPAARFDATPTERRNIKALDDVRRWCQKCYHGIPARLDSKALKSPEFRYLRTKGRIEQDKKDRGSPPELGRKLDQLKGNVGNLDQCPFHEARVCWWFSQDKGVHRTIGTVDVRIDQNRAIPYTSKIEEPEVRLHENVNDYFQTRARMLWKATRGIPDQLEVVSTMFASPRIEVGVDFKNVRDGVTHKALRSAASFQQKVGRVGREDNSDSIIATFLAHRPTDAHFAHHPARLIDAAHLDPIPLKSENPDVLRSHMFAAGLEFIASQKPNAISHMGRELNIIGTGSSSAPSWEDKVRSCIRFLSTSRAKVRSYMLAATGQDARVKGSVADEAVERLLAILQLFIVDLSGAYGAGGTVAHWMKENERPAPDQTFTQLLTNLTELTNGLQVVPGTLSPAATLVTETLLERLREDSLDSVSISQAAQDLQAVAVSMLTGGVVDTTVTQTATQLLHLATKASNSASLLGSIPFRDPFARVREAHDILHAFFEEPQPDLRKMQQYYLHDILTRLAPFRRFYPFGLVRTHFQHVNAREVTIILPHKPRDSESLSTVLYELLPGNWNYRWVRPLKSPCGAINKLGGTSEYYANLINIERAHGAVFEPIPAPPLTAQELPADMPAVPVGTMVPVLRPSRLRMVAADDQPEALYLERLIADDDEAGRVNDPSITKPCQTLPRAFPVTWFRVETDPNARRVQGKAAPDISQSVPHAFPALGRFLLEEVTFSDQLKVDRYVYAIDRTYGNEIQSPRIHYRRGDDLKPVVLGDTLKSTDGLTFRLRPATLKAVLEEALGTPGRLRGELTVRALRRFISRHTGCGPFQSEMLRKVLLMQHLDKGGILATLDAGAIQALLKGMTQSRYDATSGAIIEGLFAGADPDETAKDRARQQKWYEEAWLVMLQVQAKASGFTPALLRDEARDILVHTLAVITLDGASRLVGATDGDLSYFHRADLGELYIFDSVEGGNGCAETVERYLQIPPLQRLLATRPGLVTMLPSSDGFMLLEENLAACPAQTTARLLVESCRRGVKDGSLLRFPQGLAADLQARLRHEFDPIAGAHPLVNHLFGSQPAVFSDWQDLLWLQLVPERFTHELVTHGLCTGTDNLRSRTHLCITGCLECVNNGDGSIYGSLTSHEHVSRNLLDVLRRHMMAAEPDAFLSIPSGTPVGKALQARAGRPVTDVLGRPLTATVEDDGASRQVLLTQVLSTVSPDLTLSDRGTLLTRMADGAWSVNISFLASYRDERLC